MAVESLKEKTATGLFWSGINNGVQQLLGLAFGILLARLLSPGDYGMVGMLSIFTAMAALLQDSGFTIALINKKKITDNDYNAVFWFSLSMGCLLYVILFFSAPLIARFFHNEELIPISRVLFLWFLIGSTATVHNAFLIRNLKIKEKAKAEITALLVSSSVGVTLAWMGFAYWSIIIQTVIHGSVGTLMRWRYSTWRPSLTIDFSPLKEMFPFSVKLLITGIFTTINGNLFNILLGRLHTKREVGYFSQGSKWIMMGYSFVWNMVNNVSQPVLASVSEDAQRQSIVFRKMIRFVAFVAFPSILGLGFVSRELIVIAVSDKWLPSVEIMQIYCIWGAIMPICNLYSNLIISRGKSELYMYSTIALGLLQLLVVFLTLQYGLQMMLLAYVSLNVAWLFVWHHLVARLLPISLWVMLTHDLLPFLGVTLIALGGAYLATQSIENIYLLFVGKIGITAAIYLFIMRITKAVVLKEVIDFLSKRMRGNKKGL